MEALAKLGIDGWGLLLYLVNFGILFLLLKRFVYKPLLKVLDDRRNRIKDDVERATFMREELKKEREEEAGARTARLEELDERIKEAKKVARDEAKRLLMDAEAQRDAVLTQAAKAADETIAATIADAEKEILDRVKRVVSHVLEENVSQEVIAESVKKSFTSVTKTS